MESDPRYQVRYRDGYYLVVDTHAEDAVVPPDPGHYKRCNDGYLWVDAAYFAADDLNRAVDA